MLANHQPKDTLHVDPMPKWTQQNIPWFTTAMIEFPLLSTRKEDVKLYLSGSTCNNYFIICNFRGETFQNIVKPIISKRGFFNLTSTFRSDSDIPIPYFYYKHVKYSEDRLPSTTRIMAKKKRLMVWFVSHCNTDSRREDYIAELIKYIPIDIYGKCGNQEACGKRHTNSCLNVFLEEYKFYFAGENCFCKEYFTGRLQ